MKYDKARILKWAHSTAKFNTERNGGTYRSNLSASLKRFWKEAKDTVQQEADTKKILTEYLTVHFPTLAEMVNGAVKTYKDRFGLIVDGFVIRKRSKAWKRLITQVEAGCYYYMFNHEDGGTSSHEVEDVLDALNKNTRTIKLDLDVNLQTGQVKQTILCGWCSLYFTDKGHRVNKINAVLAA